MDSGSSRPSPSRRSGGALIVVLLILFMLLTFAAGHFAIILNAYQQSAFFFDESSLRQLAESGLALSIHDLKHNLSGHSGNLGTESWTVLSDVGEDGIASTLDRGEHDGIPTPGEPDLNPLPIGPTPLGASFFVSVYPTPYAGVFRLVSTSIGPEHYVNLERVYRIGAFSVAAAAAVSVAPGTQLIFGDASQSRLSLADKVTLSGLLIDGNDHTLTGALLDGGSSVHGIATTPGEEEGENRAALLPQIPPRDHPRVMGTGGAPSVGESPDADVKGLFAFFKANATRQLAAGKHQDAALYPGLPGASSVVFAEGDVQLSGRSSGAGVLAVEGTLTVTGSFSFQGIVIVKGDVNLEGDAIGVEILGAFMADGSFVGIKGPTRILYSSALLMDLQQVISRARSYSSIYYNEL